MNRQSDGDEGLSDFTVFTTGDEPSSTSRQVVDFGPTWRGRDGRTLLHFAAERCEFGWIRELVTRGWNPNERDHLNGATPLHLLARGYIYGDKPASYDDCITALLTLGAEVDGPDDQGDTPLHWAAAEGNYGAAKLLLQSGANVDAEGQYASTPLDCAVRAQNRQTRSGSGSPELVQLLIDAGADVNHRNESGGTPLSWSASYSPDITRLLLAAGADPRILDNEGETAMDGARLNCPEAAELIREFLEN